ncbi:MAG: nucleotidyltransferase domain-containing protein [Lachnospiraceae bacterium]
MDTSQIKQKLESDEYGFLRKDQNLGSNIILLALGGSHAYGMDKEGSDIDIRGIAINSKNDILSGNDFMQVADTDTDTTIYSFNKMVKLLASNNPNTIEILGCKPGHYLYLSAAGRELLENRKIFLSKLCIHTFAGYADSQLRRMENKAARLTGQEQNEQHILKSINNASYDFKNKYFPYDESSIKLYIGQAVTEGYNSEIFMDICLKHYPLRDWAGMWNEMKAITSSYNKIGKRNEKAVSHNKLGKHMAHLIRLYMMCIDILEKEEIITYREKEHNLLMDIRNGKYLDSNRQPVKEFYDLLNEYEKRFEYAKNNTSLPDVPDYKKIEEFKIYINEKVVTGGWDLCMH